jgi:hypothetical protein
VVPFLFPGGVMVSGQFAPRYFSDAVLRDAFHGTRTENRPAQCVHRRQHRHPNSLPGHPPAAPPSWSGKTDGGGGIVQTFTFQALEALTGSTGIATEKTTIQIQDAQA